MIITVGIVITSFLFGVLLLKKNKERADRILTVWMGVMMLHVFLYDISFSGPPYPYPHILGVILPVPILHGVFLYLYTVALTRQTAFYPARLAIHFLPFFLLAVLAIPFYGLTAEEKVAVFAHKGLGFEWYLRIQVIAILISGFSYTLASILEIRKHRRRIQEYVSNTGKRMLTWLEYLAAGLGAIWVLVLFFEDGVIFTGVVGFVLFIGFFGITQVPVFAARWLEESDSPAAISSPEPVADEPPARYRKSGLTTEDASAMMERLEELMRSEKPFTNSDLTLNDLAARLDVHPNLLSQAINSVAQKTFYHYINTYRIEEFLNLVTRPESQSFTFLALAYDCGFNSKSTFNKHFKQHTGKTPSEYFRK